MQALFNQYGWRSAKKFVPLAVRHGFTEKQAREFLKKNVTHDKKFTKGSEYFIPIVGQTIDDYQFDTLIQSRQANIPAFLIFININSRKAYAYPMKNKGSSEVLRVLNEFIKETPSKPVNMTSDQDSAYLSSEVIQFMINNNIDYHTTEDNNHNILGIINRFMRTIRDLNKVRDFSSATMNKLINGYNNSEHSATGICPNKFTNKDNLNYTSKMEAKTSEVKKNPDFELKEGSKVRIILSKDMIGKKRSNLSQNYYIIDSKDGHGYLIKSADESVAYYPRHKLVLSSTGSLAKTLNDGKRGIITEIEKYNEKSDTYKIKYTDGSTDTIPAKNLRETRPTVLSSMEMSYWGNKNKIPNSILKFKGLRS